MATSDSREFYCRKCRMKFDAKEKLANHINKYCVDSIYGEPEKLLKQLRLEQEAERSTTKHLSFGEIREFLENNQHRGIASRVGQMSLQDLRTKMNTQGVDADLEALKSEIIKRRENELIHQLQELKKSEKELIQQRKQNESKLSEKLQLFQQEQEQGLKMRLEEERVSRIISNADREHLNTLNQEKRKELEHLQELRSSLEAQEQKAMQEINELNEKIKKEEELFEQRKHEISKIRNKNGAQFEQMKMKIMQSTQKHATYSAQLKVEKEHLEQTKRELVEKLDNNNLDDKDKSMVLNDVQTQYQQQLNAIKELKQQFEVENHAMKREMNVHDELFQKLTSFPDTVDLNDYFLPEQRQKLLENTQKTAQKRHVQNQRETPKTPDSETEETEEKKEELTPTPRSTYQRQKSRATKRPETKHRNERNSTDQNNQQSAWQQPTQHSTNHAQYPHHAAPTGAGGGQTHSAQTMPAHPSQTAAAHPPHLSYMPSPHTVPPTHPHAYTAGGYPAYPPPPHHHPHAYPMQYMQPHPMMSTAHSAFTPYPATQPTMDMTANPMIQQQLNEQFKMTQKLLAQHELENELLQHELKAIHSKQEQEKTRASQREFTQTMSMLRSSLMQKRNVDGDEVEELTDAVQFGGGHEMRDFEKEERKLLTLIARFEHDEKMKKMYTDQLRAITSLKFEMQQLLQTKELQKLKHEVGTFEQQLTSRSEHELWLEEQKRLLQRKKMEKELAAQGLSIHIPHKSAAAVPAAAAKNNNKEQVILQRQLIPYQPDTGFTIYFDFITGLTNKYKQCRLASSMVHNTQIIQDTLQTTPWEDIHESQATADFIAMVGLPKFVYNVEPADNTKFLIDVQCKDHDENETHYVWTMLVPLYVRDTETWCITQGFWKLSLTAPPIMLQATAETLPQLPPSQSTLYFRILPTTDIDEIQPNGVDKIGAYKTYDPRSMQANGVAEEKQMEMLQQPIDDRKSMVHSLYSSKNNSRLSTGYKPSPSMNRSFDRSVSHKPESVASMQADMYDQENGIGVLVKYLEHQSKYPFAKLRVSLYNKDRIAEDRFGNQTVWETDFAQEGLTQLGIYEWQQRHIFDNFAYSPQCMVVFEIFECKQPKSQLTSANTNSHSPIAKRPITADSHSSVISNNNTMLQSPTIWAMTSIFKLHEMYKKPVIAVATHELRLYKCPINISNPELFEQDSSLCIQIFDPENAPIVKNVRLLQQPQDINNLQPIEETQERAWIRVENKPNITAVFDDGDGIDLYVDGARFLPENTTITKVYLQLMWMEHDEHIVKDKARYGVSEKSQSCFHPMYAIREEYRREKFDKNSVFVFRVDTVEKYSGECQTVGYSAVPVFNDSSQGDPRLYLNEGAFQLPLYYDVPSSLLLKKKNYARLKPAGKVLPCSTLLVRVVKAPRSDDGTTVLSLSDLDSVPEWQKANIVQPTPSYSDGVYDTSLCEPTINELRLYNNLQQTRADKLIHSVLLQHFKQAIDIDSNQQIDEDEFHSFFDRKLAAAAKAKQKFLDLSYFAAYNKSIGLVVSIDGINDIFTAKQKDTSSSTKLYMVIYCICPPSTFYEADFKITDNVHFTCNWDAASISTYPRFVFDKLHIFKDSDFEFHANAVLFCDIRELRFTDDSNTDSFANLKILPFGFSFFPVFKTADKDKCVYVRNGTFQNMVFRYPSQSDQAQNDKYVKSLIQRMIEDGAETVLKQQCAFTKKELKAGSDKLLKPITDGVVGKTSLLVRIYDNQRSNLQINKRVDQGLKLDAINRELIAKQKQKEYEYEPSKITKTGFWSRKPINIETLLKGIKHTDEKSFRIKLIQEIAQRLNIKHSNV